MGKTQLAVEYAFRHASTYVLVWWVRVEEPGTLASDYTRLAQRLDLPEGKEPDQQAVIAAVRHRLEQQRDWLLIFDNAGAPQDLREYLPQGNTGHVLVTSRNPNWARVARAVPVRPMPREEAITFLLKRTQQTDTEGARAIAEEVGDLPLALEQAGGYIETSGISLAQYLKVFRSRRQELWADEDPPFGYPDRWLQRRR